MDGAVNDVDGAVYDMGGVQERFGPIPVEAREPVFHHPWEKRVFSSLLMTLAMLGISEDAFRWTMERLPPAQYLRGYYQRWLATLEQMLLDRGVLAPGEIDAHLSGKPPTVHGHTQPGPLRRALSRRVVRTAVGPMPPWLARLYPRIQDVLHSKAAPPRFALGDRVVVSAAPTATRGDPHAASPLHVGKVRDDRRLPWRNGASGTQRSRRARGRRALLHSRVRRQGVVGRQR